MARPPLTARLAAEALGVYGLVTAGCGAILIDAGTGGTLGPVGISLTFGLVILVLVAATGHISGAHLNPAVTVAFALCRHFPPREVLPYAAAQLAGAVAGAATLDLLVVRPVLAGPAAAAGTLDAPAIAAAELGATLPSIAPLPALGIEVLLTAVLMFVITSVATDTRAVGELAALAIGATVALDALWGGALTGASMNPARSFGPALIAGAWQGHWIYWLGPIAGAALGGLAYQLVRGRIDELPGAES